MRDPITDAAQDPSCLLCLTPDRGGSWWSRLRPAQLRNFAADPMTWTDFMTAIADATETDWSFKIKYTLNGATGSQRIFCGGSNTGPIAIFWSSDGLMYLRTISGNGTIIQANPASDPTGTHTVEIIAASGLYSIIYDGETVRSVQDTPTIPVLVTGDVISSQFYGTIEQAEFLCGAVVWQAAYSDLYDTSNPWPSPVPENFAENAKAFYDCQAVVQEALDPTHDYSFLIEADRVSERTENSLFYAGTDKLPFGVYYHADHTIKFFTNLLRNEGDPSGTYASLNFYTGTDWLPGRHAFEARIEGNAITTYVDGVQCATSNKFARTGTAAVGLPNCNSGYVYKIQITDLTDNQVVWSYPSEAERVRLITKTNVRTDRGAFEAADETQPARVDTALDLRRKVSSYTVVVDFEAAEFPETTTMECHQELAGQGGALIGSGTPPICSIGYYLTSSGSARLQLSQEVAGGRHVVNATLTGRLSGRHICCGVVEVDPAAPLTASTLYLDGVRIGNASIYAVPTGNAAVNARCFSIAGHSFTGGWPPYTGKVYSGLLFDRALSAAEIAALTPKQA